MKYLNNIILIYINNTSNYRIITNLGMITNLE
nr:MAG TPA: hypothetical protein [Caudoviricetes sp.]